MSRKSYLLICATVLASFAMLAVTVPQGHEGMALAGESAHVNDDTDHMQDHRSLVLAGRLVRVADVSSATCEHRPPVAVDANAIHATVEAYLAHVARLSAEYRGLEEIVLPPELQSQKDDAQFAAALRNERVAFAERKEAQASQLAALNQAKELIEREVEFTQAKEAALGRQQTLLQKELDNINGLMSRGLAVSSQKLTLEQSVLQSETNRLDLKLSILKAQQEVRKIEHNLTDLRTQWQNEIRGEISKTQGALAALAQQAKTTRATGGADPASPQQAGSSCDDAKESFYVIVRGASGLLQAFPVASKNETRGDAGAVIVQKK